MSVKSLVSDPDFEKLNPQEKQAALASVDPDFANIGVDEVDPVINQIRGPVEKPKSKLDMITDIKQRSGFDLSPIGLLQSASDLAQKGSNRLGEATTEMLGQRGIPAPISAGIGTAISMAPDLLSLAGAPPESALKTIPKSAIPMASRALGFQKRFLMTPFARGQAAKAAETALQNDVIPLLGNPNTAFNRAATLSANSGRNIGKTLNKIEFSSIAPDAERDLEVLRNTITKGTKRGLLSSANNVIDTVKSTILELYGRGATAAEYNEAKSVLGNSLNHLSDLSSQSVNKRVVNTMATTIREKVKNLLPDSYDAFLKNQRAYNASKLMQKGLNNEIAGQTGNAFPSIAGTVGAAAQMASGNPAAAAKTIGLIELGKRRGAGAAARALTEINNQPGKVIPASVALMRAQSDSTGKDITEEKAKEFFKKALRKTKDEDKARRLAREMAVKEGYTIPE